MKKLITTITLMLLAIPALAQYNYDGVCRTSSLKSHQEMECLYHANWSFEDDMLVVHDRVISVVDGEAVGVKSDEKLIIKKWVYSDIMSRLESAGVLEELTTMIFKASDGDADFCEYYYEIAGKKCSIPQEDDNINWDLLYNPVDKEPKDEKSALNWTDIDIMSDVSVDWTR